MNELLVAAYEQHRLTTLMAFCQFPTKVSESYAFALFNRLPPIFNNNLAIEAHDGDCFETCYKIDKNFALEFLKYVDDCDQSGDKAALEFYNLEERFGGYKTNRVELIHLLEYMRIDGRFDDAFYRSVEKNAPIEAQGLASSFRPDEVYFGS